MLFWGEKTFNGHVNIQNRKTARKRERGRGTGNDCFSLKEKGRREQEKGKSSLFDIVFIPPRFIHVTPLYMCGLSKSLLASHKQKEKSSRRRKAS